MRTNAGHNFIDIVNKGTKTLKLNDRREVTMICVNNNFLNSKILTIFFVNRDK